MDEVNITKILNRTDTENHIISLLKHFEENKNLINIKRGIYIFGNPGSGKSYLISSILKKLNYDIILYDAGDIRNKSIIETITNHNMPDTNVLSMFKKKKRKLAIIMDEIDGMNNGDKGGLNTLIKLIRPKKTKKQKLEDLTMIPIICIGNYQIDKKIKELMKVCDIIELKDPEKEQIKVIIYKLFTKLKSYMKDELVDYIQNDLRKLNMIFNIYEKNKNILTGDDIYSIFQKKTYSEDTKTVAHKLIINKMNFNDHGITINETDRTIVALLWHENIVDLFNKYDKKKSIELYLKLLKNFCFADYTDRITFQKQIWQFNEMSSLIKTFYNNYILHKSDIDKTKYNPPELRFTKVLTKYSTEYNNMIFIQLLCQELNMDKKDMLGYFNELKNKNLHEDETISLFEGYDISKLDINRIYRYIIYLTTPNEEDVKLKDIYSNTIINEYQYIEE
tara:strand:+ start:2026 stop:3375 length:1350 start_codon:yes stop_codon:yes gene_type:complete